MLISASSGLAITSSRVTVIIERFHTFEDKITTLIDLDRTTARPGELERQTRFADQFLINEVPGGEITFGDALADFSSATDEIAPVDTFFQSFAQLHRLTATARISSDARLKLSSRISRDPLYPASVRVASYIGEFFDLLIHGKIH